MLIKKNDVIFFKEEVTKHNKRIDINKQYKVFHIIHWDAKWWVDVNDMEFVRDYGTSRVSIDLIETLEYRRRKKLNKIMKYE